METRADVIANYTAMQAQFKAMGVIALRRRTLEASLRDPHTVEATFVTQYVLRGHLLSDETVGNSLIVQDGGRWKIGKTRYASRNPGINQALNAAKQRRDTGPAS